MSMQCNAMYFCMGRAEEAGDLGCLRAAFWTFDDDSDDRLNVGRLTQWSLEETLLQCLLCSVHP